MPSKKKNLSHLHSDELDHILEYIDLTNLTTNLNLSLVNREFHQITSSDHYWKQILNNDSSINYFIKRTIVDNCKKKYLFFKKESYPRRIKQERKEEFDKHPFPLVCCACLCLCSFVLTILGLCFYGIIQGSLNYANKAECVREIVSRERIEMFEVMPENGVCKDCKVYNSSLGNCTWIENKKIPDYYPCCLSESNCTYDRISTGKFHIVYKISNYVVKHGSTIFVHPLEIYQCEEGNCRRETKTKYTETCLFDPVSKTSTPFPYISSFLFILIGSAFLLCCCCACVKVIIDEDRCSKLV